MHSEILEVFEWYTFCSGINMHGVIPLLLSILIANAAGAVGTVFTMPAISTWYAGLIKPALSPPNWVFGPVWTTLFTLMGIAAFLVWQKRRVSGARLALAVYGGQLALNALWSILFFGLQNPAAALVEIAFLWFAIFATMLAFVKISRLAAGLLLPYLFWVSFAAYLNYAIWSLNYSA